MSNPYDHHLPSRAVEQPQNPTSANIIDQKLNNLKIDEPVVKPYVMPAIVDDMDSMRFSGHPISGQ